MAAKDTAPYLDDCINSIINQSYSKWELIVVNDHSSDNTLEILNQFAQKDARIKVYDGTIKKLIPSLTHAYSLSKGSLIHRMDSDDIMPIYKLQVLCKEWSKHGKGTVTAGGAKHFIEGGKIGDGLIKYENWLNHITKHNTYRQNIYTECVIPSQCWLVHRDDFDMIGGFEKGIYPEDYDLCFRFYKFKLKIIGINKVLNHWRDRPTRISRTLEEYRDNRFLNLKIKYFYELDRELDRPLVLWGAGKNGKDLAKLLLEKESNFHWVCDNDKKIGKDIYGIRMHHFNTITNLHNPQILILVAAPDGKIIIENQLLLWNKKMIEDYWFYL